MSTAALAILAASCAVLVAALALIAYVLVRLVRPQQLVPTDTDSLYADPEFEPEDELPTPPPFFVPDYIDADGLTALAIELGLDVDPVRVEITTGQQHAAGVALGVEAHLTLPGVAEVVSNVSGTETSVDLSQQAVGTTRRQGFTALITDVVNCLSELNRIHGDLGELPAATRHLSLLARGLITVYDEWGCRGLPPTPPPPPPPQLAHVVAAALVPPQPPASPPTPEQLLRDAADMLWGRALDVILAAKREELQHLSDSLPGITYALSLSTWRVATDPDGTNLRLYNTQLRPSPLDPEVVSLLTPGVIEVPLNPHRLTDSGRQRLTPGASDTLMVFGRIGSFSAEKGTLTLHPLAVFAG